MNSMNPNHIRDIITRIATGGDPSTIDRRRLVAFIKACGWNVKDLPEIKPDYNLINTATNEVYNNLAALAPVRSAVMALTKSPELQAVDQRAQLEQQIEKMEAASKAATDSIEALLEALKAA